MCGIGGFLWVGAGPAPVDPERSLRQMSAAMHNRGPDDNGTWHDQTCGLAHARLAIIDLSPAGHQPMGSADGRVWLSYNGEIYNFMELRAQLEAKGYLFRSRSDTEVIICGYLAWGEDVFSRLRGMFAIALWDKAERKLLLARDRVGKKPLYYSQLGDFVVFGSEIKALLTWPALDRAPDLVAIDQYLTFQYVPAPRTAFASVRKLPAAHYLEIGCTRNGWRMRDPVQFWRLPAPTFANNRARPADLARELVDRLMESVKLRMISDVPLGAFLSGGVDSSAVVALMSKAGAGAVKTFSIGFPNKEYDETRYARMVAQRYGTDHEEMIVEPDAIAIIPQLVWHYGEPFADPSAVPTYYLSE